MPDASAQESAAAGDGRLTGPGTAPRALRNTALVLAARVVSRALALFTVLLTGRHLSADSFGRFGLLVTITSIVTVLIDLGFNTLFPREAARHPGEISRFLSNLVTLRLLMGFAALAVLALVLLPFGLDYLLLPGFLLMMLQSYAGLLRQTFYARQQVGYEAVGILIESLVLLVLTVYGVTRGGNEVFFVWAYAAMWAVACAYIVTVLHLRGFARLSLRFETAFFRRWLAASLPFAMTFVITTIYFKADQPTLKLFRPYSEVGLYVAAYKPFEALLFVPVTMMNVVYPVLAVLHREAPERLLPALERFYRLLLLVGWPVSVGTVVLAGGLTNLMWGSHYAGSAAALAILGAGIVLMFVNNTFIAGLNSIDRQLSFTWASVVSMVANVALNLALIPPLGYLGASCATVVTEAVLLAAAWWLLRKHLAGLALHRLSWRIVLAGLVMGAVLLPFRGATGYAVLALVAGGAVVYGGAALLLRAVDAGEWDMLRRAVAR